jgi:hypothetical protein
VIRCAAQMPYERVGKTTALKRPVLRDGNGKELYRFESATVLQFSSGEDALQTEPDSLPTEFPFSAYAGRHSTPLYLGDDDHSFPVMLAGRKLAIVSSNIERGGPHKG